MSNGTVIGNNLRTMTTIFFYIVIVSLLAYFFPVDSTYGISYGLYVLLVFFLVYMVGTICGYLLLLPMDVKMVTPKKFSSKYMIKIPIIISVIGLLFILFDRIFYRGINPFLMSPAVVRYMLNESASGNVSSIFSLLGNILQCFIIIPAYYVISRKLSVTKLLFPGLFVISLLSSFLLGGRTPLLCFLVLLLSFVIMFNDIFKFKILANLFFVFTIFITFTIFVFVLRAEATGLKSPEYTINLLRHLHFNPDLIFLSGGGVYDDIYNYTLIVFAYALHPFAISSDAILNGSGQGNISFFAISFLLSKFFPIDMESLKHDYYEMFVSLPGGLYYDYGLLGVILFSLIASMLNFLSLLRMCKSNGNSDVARIFTSIVISTFIFSPLLSSLNFVFYLFYATVLLTYFIIIKFVGLVNYE